MVKECNFFGYKITCADENGREGSIAISDEKRAQIDAMPFPTNVKQMRSFIGSTVYYSNFIPHYSSLMAPMVEMTTEKFKSWDDDTVMTAKKKSFQDYKNALAAAMFLAYPNYSLPWTLRTDASQYGVGAVLFQTRTLPDGTLVHEPLHFVSSKFSNEAQRWSTIEQECYAIYYAMRNLEYYLWGNPIVIETDHNNLQYMEMSVVPKIVRWRIYIQSFMTMIKHIPGKLKYKASHWYQQQHKYVQKGTRRTGAFPRGEKSCAQGKPPIMNHADCESDDDDAGPPSSMTAGGNGPAHNLNVPQQRAPQNVPSGLDILDIDPNGMCMWFPDPSDERLIGYSPSDADTQFDDEASNQATIESLLEADKRELAILPAQDAASVTDLTDAAITTGSAATGGDPESKMDMLKKRLKTASSAAASAKKSTTTKVQGQVPTKTDSLQVKVVLTNLFITAIVLSGPSLFALRQKVFDNKATIKEDKKSYILNGAEVGVDAFLLDKYDVELLMAFPSFFDLSGKWSIAKVFTSDQLKSLKNVENVALKVLSV